ncbi:MAG: efflux RND transporter periplasmic adaptor subunit [Polyangiales bacterium]
MNKWVRRGVYVLVAAGAAAGIATAMKPRPAEVEVAQVRVAPLRVEVVAEGRTRVERRYTLSAPLAGELSRVELRPGDAVEAEQVVATIHPLSAPLLDPRARTEAQLRVQALRASAGDARARVARAEAAVALARGNARTAGALATGGAGTTREAENAALELRAREAELESARFAERVARFELASAEAALSRGGASSERGAVELRAPVRGRVLKVERESAGVIAAGAPVMEVGDLSRLEVVAEVLTADAVRVAPNAAVRFTHWGGGDALAGRVRRVEPSAFTRTSALGVEEQRVLVIVDLDAPPAAAAALGDGFRVEAAITTWASDAALQVDAGALVRDGDAWAVYVVEGGVARRRAVTTGHASDAAAEVLGGLRAGERVVLHPSDSVRDGAAVTPR